jgi:ferredoxin--NADP+ reductase
MREYSVYSSSNEAFLEILVKEVDGGYVSRKLKQLKAGQDVVVEGPFGFFTIDKEQHHKKLYFIATGTGISPFHSFVKSYNDLDYHLIHGVRYINENYDLDSFHPNRVVRCISREDSEHFTGRVTDYLRSLAADNKIDTDGLYYLCGNCDMIYESFDILSEAGVENTQLFAEVYF